VEMGYLTVLYVRLGAKIGDLHAKDSNSFRNRLMLHLMSMVGVEIATPCLRSKRHPGSGTTTLPFPFSLPLSELSERC
jgi:hypothetical protein